MMRNRYLLCGRQHCILQSSADGFSLRAAESVAFGDFMMWHPVRYGQSMTTISSTCSLLGRIRRLPGFVWGWLWSEHSLNADFLPAVRAPIRRGRMLIYPVVVVDHSMISADVRRAASRPAGMRFVLVDDDLEPSEISNAARVAAASKGALPMAVHVASNDAGEVCVSQTRLTIPQATRVVHSAVENPGDSCAAREARRSVS